VERLRRFHLFAVRGLHGGIVDLQRPPGHPYVAPSHLRAGTGVGLQREAGVAAQVERLERVRHHPQPQLAAGDPHLQPGRARRAVLAEGGEDVMGEGPEARLDGPCELGFGGGEGGPVRRILWHTSSVARIPDNHCPVTPGERVFIMFVGFAVCRWRASVTCVTVAHSLHRTDLFCGDDRR
jgi:hypothetical protein